MLDREGEIVEHLAGVEDALLADATYEAALRRWPKVAIILRQGANRPFDEHDLTHAMRIAEDLGGKNLRITLLGWVICSDAARRPRARPIFQRAGNRRYTNVWLSLNQRRR
jgi:hypothetical protein